MIENVSHPKHYTTHPSGIECIEITRHHNFNIGNAIKYLWRAGIKQEAGKSDKDKEIEDLQKAVWYIQDHINTLQGNLSHKQCSCKCNCKKDKGHYTGLDRKDDNDKQPFSYLHKEEPLKAIQSSNITDNHSEWVVSNVHIKKDKRYV